MGRFFSGALLTLVFTPIVLSVVLVAALRWMPPPTTSFMLQSPVKPVQYRWVPAGKIADVARKAVVASEDQLFFQHHGFDVEAMQKALENNKKKHRKIRGGSTISQQTAKNLFLWPGGGYARKGIEAYLTMLIEAMWTKQRILEMYLNIAEFGPGVYGIEAASKKYIGKSASQLSAADAARLIAVLPSPRRWHAASPGPYVQRRATWIMGQMGYGAPHDEEPDEGAPESEDVAPVIETQAQDKVSDTAATPEAKQEIPEREAPESPAAELP